jgi:hypothetical protein
MCGTGFEIEVVAALDGMRRLGCADLDRSGVRRRDCGCQANDGDRRHHADDHASEPA